MMSILFGVLYNDQRPVGELELHRLAQATERYAGDGLQICPGTVGMGVQSYYTHLISHGSLQLLSDAQGNVISFDGRLDNHMELVNALRLSGAELSDAEIVLAAFAHWEEDCFAKLIGDWALALWSFSEDTLYLARDHAGSRSLYYKRSAEALRWATYLETLVGTAHAQDLDDDYLVHYLAGVPLHDETPYRDIRTVLAGHVVKFKKGKLHSYPHWECLVSETIHYPRDQDYEGHFFHLFRQAVERRTGEGSPILAQLSGGMDSTSIVCMSDYIQRSRGESLLDTLSYFDDEEPEWNEKPYFTLVERQRGKEGIHIESSYQERTFAAPRGTNARYLLPGADSGSLDREVRFQEALGSRGYRVLLSGIGGDEVLGAALTGVPELGDYLRSGRMVMLARQSLAWSLTTRRPLVHLARELTHYTWSLYFNDASRISRVPPWMTSTARTYCAVSTSSGSNWRHLPSRIENARAWWSVQATLPHLWPAYLSRLEYRYPCLDRDLVEFLYRIPRAQLVRPGMRRSLQTRSLQELLPEGILQRGSKAYASRGLSIALQNLGGHLKGILDHSIAVQKGFVDPARFTQAVEEYSQGLTTSHAIGIFRFLSYEAWANALRDVTDVAEMIDGARQRI